MESLVLVGEEMEAWDADFTSGTGCAIGRRSGMEPAEALAEENNIKDDNESNSRSPERCAPERKFDCWKNGGTSQGGDEVDDERRYGNDRGARSCCTAETKPSLIKTKHHQSPFRLRCEELGITTSRPRTAVTTGSVSPRCADYPDRFGPVQFMSSNLWEQ